MRTWPPYRSLLLAFTGCVGALWLLAASAKVFALADNVAFLRRSNPVFMISNSRLLAIASVAEFAAAGYLLFSPALANRLVLTTVGALCFLLYRIALGLVSPYEQCNCLGNALGLLGLGDSASDELALFLVFACSIGSVALWLLKPRNPSEVVEQIPSAEPAGSRDGFGFAGKTTSAVPPVRKGR